MECSVFFADDGADPIASEPLIVRVTLLSKVKGFAFWVILLPLLLLRENRARKALWILLPYYVWMGLATGASALTGRYGMGTAFGTVIPLLALLGGLLLLGQRIQKWNGWIVLLAAILFAALVHGIWIWTGMAENLSFSAIASGILCLVVLVSFLLARLCCRRRYGGAELALFLLLFVMLVTMLFLSIVAILLFMQFSEAGIAGLGMMLVGMAISIVLVGLIIYLVLLSFLTVPLSSEFYRSRLCGLLKLKRDAPPAIEPPVPS